MDELADWLSQHAGRFGAYREHRPGAIEEQMELESQFQRHLWDEGWLRRGWPEDCGGLGGSALDRGAVYESICAAGYLLPEGLATAETIAPALIRFARPLAQRLLPAYLRGDEAWCQGFSEPDAGSDLASLRTKAVVEGDVVRVTGQKVWSSQGSMARRCLLLARSGPEPTGARGLTMLLVDLDSPGVAVRAIRAANGRNEFAEIFFDDVEVPITRVLGAPGQGWEITMHLLQWERGMFAWQRQAFLHSRLQSMLPGAVDVTLLGDAFVRLAALRLTCRKTLRALAEGQDRGAEVSVDKVLLSEAEQTVMDLIRVNSGRSFLLSDSTEAQLDRQDWFYSRATSIYGGAVEVQLNILAERVLDLPREPRVGRR
jgi:acyl-CoA dehydrogenase